MKHTDVHFFFRQNASFIFHQKALRTRQSHQMCTFRHLQQLVYPLVYHLVQNLSAKDQHRSRQSPWFFSLWEFLSPNCLHVPFSWFFHPQMIWSPNFLVQVHVHVLPLLLPLPWQAWVLALAFFSFSAPSTFFFGSPSASSRAVCKSLSFVKK